METIISREIQKTIRKLTLPHVLGPEGLDLCKRTTKRHHQTNSKVSKFPEPFLDQVMRYICTGDWLARGNIFEGTSENT